MNTNHPPALRIFFATEMWERYGFYVVQTLLAMYLALHFHASDKHTYELVGSFTALTYLSPLLGGWIADHLLGQKRAILAGSLLLCISYFALSIIVDLKSLCMSLAGIAMGTGLLKPNIPSLLGNEYPEGSPNRENGFTIFYIGLTLGILLGTTIPSTINYHFGWSVAFMSASFGMIISASIFLYGIYRYKIVDYHDYPHDIKKIAHAFGLIVLAWGISIYILNDPHVADIIFISVAVCSLVYLFYCAKKETPAQARRTFVIGLLCIISVLFWAFYFQMFMSFTLFILRTVKPTLFGIPFPPPYYVGLQSLGMVLIGLFLTRKPNQLNPTAQMTKTGHKFLLAMVLITVTYAIITIICRLPIIGLLSPLYLIPAYLVLSLAELLLSPVGLSAVTVLASRKRVSTMMGIFFVSLGIGGYLSGKLAKITAMSSEQLTSLNVKASYAASFSKLFIILIIMSTISLILMWIITQLLKQAAILDQD